MSITPAALRLAPGRSVVGYLVKGMALWTSALRSLEAYGNVFAPERSLDAPREAALKA